MWPFKTIDSLEKSEILNGFTDWHSHILPGVDDGIKNIEDSINVLKRYESLGITKVWLTPHVMEDYPNSPESLRKTFQELKSRWDGKVELQLASENMLDSLFEERLEKNEFLPIGDEGKHLLVETSYYNPPMDMYGMLEGVKKKGYFPILAHPERYRYMDQSDYRKLKDMEILFQINLISLVGGYGESAQKKAEWLLSNGMVDLFGSDLHRLGTFEEMIKRSPKKNMYIKILSDLIAGQPIK